MTGATPRPAERRLWWSAAGLAAAYVAAAATVALWPPVAAFDAAVLAALEPWRSGAVLAAAAWITRLGDNLTLLVIALATAAVLWRRRDRALLSGLGVSAAGSQAVLWISKWAFARPRPEFVTDVTAVSPAFPSGHATGAVVVFGMVACAVARHAGGRTVRTTAMWLCAVVAAAVGLSRVLVHVHHPSDVAAGLLLGGAWLLAGMAVTGRVDRVGDRRRAARATYM